MFDFENLNDKDILELLEETKEHVKHQSSEWNYKNEADPGITILELLVWFIYMQREYLANISPMIASKLLKILGVKSKRNRGAKTLIQINNFLPDSEILVIPKGTKFLANNLVFENEEYKILINAQIISLRFKNPEVDEEKNYYELDGIKKFFVFGKNANDLKSDKKDEKREFYVNFDKEIPKNKRINLYFDVFLENDLKRNPVMKDDIFEPIAYVKWEYFGLENEKNLGWNELTVVKDDTHNFLFSGIITFEFKNKILPYEKNNCFVIRATLLSGDYDFSPQIVKIIPNTFEVVQKDTHCEKTYFKKKEVMTLNNESYVILKNHLSLYGKIIVFIKNNFGKWVILKENFKLIKNIDKNNAKLIFYDNLFTNEENNDEICLMIISFSDQIEPFMKLGSGKSFSGQKIEIDFKNTPLYNEFEILVAHEENNEKVFEIWNRIDDFFSSDKYDKKFIYEENIKSFFFGDNICGQSPKKCEDSILLASISFTNEEASNIKSNLINGVISENLFLKNSKIIQIIKSKGGRSNEKLIDARKRALDLYSPKLRAVTIEDYVEIVSKTPGLIFTNLEILPVTYNSNKNFYKTIMIKAKCANKQKLPESYVKNILNKINRYRLLNTKVVVE